MNFKLLLTIFVFAFHARSYALGLGEIQVNSSLNQPFSATIELQGVDGINENELLIRLGSDSDFQRMGISKEAVLLQLTFQPNLKQDPPVIRVTSGKPIREPFLNFVLELQSPKAQLLKEYTVLLNPAP